MSFFDSETPFFSSAEGRVEAVAKVTGSGKYAAEYTADKLCYAAFAVSTITAGTIVNINVTKAKQMAGVLDIITHTNKPLVPAFATEEKIKEARFGLPIFHTNKIYFKGQPIALVIAESLEDATYAASLISAEYSKENFETNFTTAKNKATLKPAGKDRGNIDGITNAIVIEGEYNMQAEVHNPMEMHATIAHWISDNKLTLFDKNQGVISVQRTFARLFAIPQENITVVSEFVGGGFGSGLRVWPHALATIMAAKQVNRPVKLMLTRNQMFYMVGYRPQSWQKIKLMANANGKFLGIHHQSMHGTCLYENFSENITGIARILYNFEHVKTESAVVPLNLSTPTWMRGPGDCTGDFAIECAIDELCYTINADPVAIRLQNFALEKDPQTGKPWSTNFVNECVEKGAALIGWSNRPKKPNTLVEGNWKIGYGMAVGMWGAGRGNASASIEMQKDGSIVVKTAMTDIGTGTGTAMQNIVHTNTNIEKNKIKVELGNSSLPPAGSQGGSTGLSSISGAVNAVCNTLKAKLIVYANTINEAYKNAAATDIILNNDGITLKNNTQFIAYTQLFEANKLTTIAVEASSGPGAERQQYSFCASAAHFCRVKVHTKTGKVKVDKMVCVVDGGTIINEKPAANQVSGAAVGGIGMALMEEQLVDAASGGLIGADFAGYHVAVNADAPIIEVAFINKPDYNSNPSGAKGLGEVGIIGAAPAIANAIYNAIGKRIKDLPITPDKIVG
jgi:xanthine dehydrogenase YagR molybdenum-binding subunit